MKAIRFIASILFAVILATMFWLALRIEGLYGGENAVKIIGGSMILSLVLGLIWKKWQISSSYAVNSLVFYILIGLGLSALFWFVL